MIAAKLVYCVITEGVDRQNSAALRYVVEFVLQENFVLSIKTLRECLV